MPYAIAEDPYWAYVRSPDFDLGAAALAVGIPEYPDLDVAQFVAVLDHLGDMVGERTSALTAPADRLRRLAEVLYMDAGLQGAADEEFYDPRNSYLHEVLERHVGIPISLGIIYMEVGRRAGIRLQGVGSPSHFLVRQPDSDLYLDPFRGGAVMDREGATRLVVERSGGRLTPDQEPLPLVDKRSVLKRLLGNLKRLYLDKMEFERALHVVNKLIILDPEAAQEYRDRGVMHFQLEFIPEGIADLERYLALAPVSPDTRAVREQVSGLKRMLEMMR